MAIKTVGLTDEEITNKVKKIVISALYAKKNIEDIDVNVPLTSLGMDSLNVVDIFIGLEHDFDIELDESELDMSIIESISSLVKYVKSLGEA
ncbi:MAG: acyl carrier protein [Alphaproteobacteria bacterium]|nr:acyl carrier protein [Alphaproteobacteria bacterium]